MKIMGRITLDKVHLPGITAELRAAGWDVSVCPDELIEPSDREEFVFIEASRDVVVDPQDVVDVSSEMLDELEYIAQRHGRGECWSCGPVPPDHVPHNYDTPWWTERRH
jgi:hypothetical protein